MEGEGCKDDANDGSGGVVYGMGWDGLKYHNKYSILYLLCLEDMYLVNYENVTPVDLYVTNH